MPDILVQALEDWKENRHFFGRENNINLTQNNSLVFGNNDGSVRSYSGTKAIFKRFLKSNNLDKFGIHFHGLPKSISFQVKANTSPVRKPANIMHIHKGFKNSCVCLAVVKKVKFIFNQFFNYAIDNKLAINLTTVTRSFTFPCSSNFGTVVIARLTEIVLFSKSISFQVSPRTFEHVYRNFKLHIEPKIGKMKIEEVSTTVSTTSSLDFP